MQSYLQPPEKEPRDYQLPWIKTIDDGWSDHHSQLAIMPTGTGKTVTAAHVARKRLERFGRPILFVVQRDELVRQAVEEFEACGMPACIEKAQKRAFREIRDARHSLFDARDIRVVVGSLQSMRGKRLEKFPADYFDLVIYDEAHHAWGDSSLALLQHFASGRAKLLFMTATPDRTDGKRLCKLAGHVAVEMLLPEAIALGYLADLRVAKAAEPVDLSGLRMRAGDFDAAELEFRITPKLRNLCTSAAHKLADNARPFLDFNPDVRTARMSADLYNGLGISAEAVWSKHPERDGIIKAYKAGRFRGLCVCGIGTEGFDHPPIQDVVLKRATKSMLLAAQMIGRATRKSEGKAFGRAIDFNWMTDDTKDHVIKAYEVIYSGEMTDPERMAIESLLANGEDVSPHELRKRFNADAIDEMGRIKAAAREEDRRLKGQVGEYERVQFREDGWFGPIDPSQAVLSPVWFLSSQVDRNGPPAPDKAVASLMALGVPQAVAEGLTAPEAARRAGVLQQRSQRGLAAPESLVRLLEAGVPEWTAHSMTQREAAEFLALSRRGAR